MQINNQWIFVDESGKPEIFSAKGKNLVEIGVASKFLVLSAVRSNDQLKLQQQITNFRSLLLNDQKLKGLFSSAYTLDSFHAQTDYPEVKERFYQFIGALEIKVDVIVVEKLLCYAPLKQNPGKLYGVMSGQLLKNICHLAKNTEIIFSRKDSKLKLRQELETEVERVRLDYLQKHHNPHYSHGGLQIADYVSFAIFQAFENKDLQWYEIIKNRIGKIQDICHKKYFTSSDPLKLST